MKNTDIINNSFLLPNTNTITLKDEIQEPIVIGDEIVFSSTQNSTPKDGNEIRRAIYTNKI